MMGRFQGCIKRHAHGGDCLLRRRELSTGLIRRGSAALIPSGDSSRASSVVAGGTGGMAPRQTTGFVESLLRLIDLGGAVPDFNVT